PIGRCPNTALTRTARTVNCAAPNPKPPSPNNKLAGRRGRRAMTLLLAAAAAVRCSGLFGATVLVPNRNEPRSEGLATAGLPNVNDCDPRVLAEPSIDLVLEGAGILIAMHHRSVLPEELHLHQKTPFRPNETAQQPGPPQ